MGRHLSGSRIRTGRYLCTPPLAQDNLCTKMRVHHGIALTRNKLPRSENGKRYVTDQKLIAFVNILKVPVIWLLGGTNDPAPKH